MKIFNKTRSTIVAQNAWEASGMLERLRGLLGKSHLKQGEALILRSCQSIHTFFMRFTIDVIFVDSQNKVVLVRNKLKPWRLSPICLKATYAIELPAGMIVATSTIKGDELVIS